MKVLHYTLGITTGIALIFALLITSFEIAAYSDFGWYEKEYAKYEVLEELEMEMPDVMEVTEEMMAYLRGNREDLVVDTVIDGQEREFFNDREKAHMADVQKLFLGGLALRRGSLLYVLLGLILLIAVKSDWKKVIPKSFLMGLGIFMTATVGFGILCAADFNKYFIIFHEIFFDNDLWILDPRTDWLIRMLPQGFFFDMVVRIVSIFVILMGIMAAASIWSLLKQRNKKNL